MKRTLVAGALVAALSAVALAQVKGAIYTGVADGSAVNANIYESKPAVYLNGGPQNHSSAGLSPDGDYYFQVTDPSGAVLLSEDDISCRVVRVAGGRIVGTPAGNAGGYGNPACYHVNGVPNASNGGTSVQLMPYADTPNNGGEYKAWLTPVAAYEGCGSKFGSHGFCNDESKTDNFKVRKATRAYVSVCKFNDRDGNGEKNDSEPFIPHWPITATGVDRGTVGSQTGDDGCVSFTVSEFNGTSRRQIVTLSEGTFGPDWSQTAPLSCGATPECSVADGVITLVVGPGDDVQAPAFGNTNPYCDDQCVGDTPVMTATSYASLTRSYVWDITKDVDRTRATTATGNATFNYTVSVTHDAGTDSNWQVTGVVRVSNPGGTTLAGLNVVELADNGGTCEVNGGTGLTVAAGSHIDLPYVCTYTAAPPDGTLTATGTWDGGTTTATTAASFTGAAVNVVDGEAAITDTLAGSLGTVAATAPSPITFNYSRVLNGVAGTCVTSNNVATFATNTTATTGSASRAAEVCVGANLQVSTTATTTFVSEITKAVDRTLVQQKGGNATLNYTVRVAESGWQVSGSIDVVNPNDWESVTFTASSLVAGATCAVTGTGPFTVPPSGAISLAYSCSFAAAPPASGSETATITWDEAAASTPANQASASASYAFAPLVITDTFDGATSALGTIAAPAALTTYAYPRTVPAPVGGLCRAYVNTAAITGRSQSASQTATVCNTATGAHTIGFWQNKNGQLVITGGAAVAGICKSGTWLRQFTPFQDLAANASCRTVAAYATTLIKAASSAGAAMNAMLKAQMLASAFSVYFSDPALGGNAIGAPTAVGAVRIDLTQVCAAISATACNGMLNASAAFGGAADMTVANMLLFQNGVANAGGSMWYANVKTIQGLAKNAFDAINNQVAYIAP